MIHLVTDSTAYLPPEIKARYNVRIVSLKIIVGDQTYDEEGGITQEAFYKLLDSVATAPTTSQPSSGEFLAVYEPLVQDDDEVISIHISEGLSGTVPNARIAAQEVAAERITVVDSRTTSVGLVVMIIAAGEAVAAGKRRDEIVQMLERMAGETETVFMVENLAYLHKGGRINTAARLLGTLLNIKPILYLSEGKIEPLDKARSSKKAKRRILDRVVQQMGGRPVRVAVAHIFAPEAAAQLAERASAELNCVSVDMTQVGPVIGSHVGPGVLGIAACPVGEDGF